jgi:hypothetical protein
MLIRIHEPAFESSQAWHQGEARLRLTVPSTHYQGEKREMLNDCRRLIEVTSSVSLTSQ